MKSLKNIFLLFLSMLFVNAVLFSQTIETGKSYHGFKLLQKRFIKEVNGECFYFEHVKSGAHLLKIAADDPNKTFIITFKTDPESDAGTPHIMEHAVLNGSKKFPVKSPFDVLSKGSLNTFINAFTGNDRTYYPLASMNNKDYFNLMNVYLDAVFNPRFYSDPRILKQEGWHYELTGKDEPIVYKGVVYNEMKGEFSDPNTELFYRIYKNLFPDNMYRFTAGGYPSAIPKLTVEEFKNYHRKYYHPSNSLIFLYGDADLDKELEFIDNEYLKNYDASNFKMEFPLQKSFDKPKEVTAVYPTVDSGSTENQTFLTMNFVTGPGSDPKLLYALYAISDILVAQESAPIRKALKEANIGMDVIGDVTNLNQITFTIEAQNANPQDKEEFKKIIYRVFDETVKNGIDKKSVEGFINRFEFQIRELNDPQIGITFGTLAASGWMYADNPFNRLEYEKTVAELKEDVKKGYLESIIKKYILENNHALLLVLKPEPGLETKRNSEIENELEAYKEKLSEEEIESLIKDTNELMAFQKEEDTPEAVATIPMLTLKDINPKAAWFESEQSKLGGIPALFYEKVTNNIVYSQLNFDLRVLPQELIPYASILAEILGNVNTKNYSYADLEKTLNIYLGGFSAAGSLYFENQLDQNIIPKFIVNSKAMNDKLDEMVELMSEIITTSKFDDKERIKYLLARLHSRKGEDIKSNGFDYAVSRVRSYYSNRGMFNEIDSGIEFYWFLSNLLKNYDDNADMIISNLKKTAGLIFNKKNMLPFVTCTKEDYEKYNKAFGKYELPSTGNVDYHNWNLKPEKKNEGFLTASKVQYVLQGYDYKKLGYGYTGRLRVLNQILSKDWLHNRIRVMGGAYGGFCSISAYGQFIFASYRDPNLESTLDTYAGSSEYLQNFTANETDMTRYIIGTIASMDLPLTPQQEGRYAFRYFLEKTSKADLQKERDEVLSTTAGDIKEMQNLVADVVTQKNYCVYGSEDKVNESKALFDTVKKIIE